MKYTVHVVPKLKRVIWNYLFSYIFGVPISLPHVL